MKQSVMIKGNKMGLILWLDPNTVYSVLYEEMMQKFQASSSFFSFSKPIALKFEGKRLEQEQISEILDGISNLTSLQIAYIIDEDIASQEEIKINPPDYECAVCKGATKATYAYWTSSYVVGTRAPR